MPLVSKGGLLEALSHRAAELAATLPSLDLNTLAEEVQRINFRLADVEGNLAIVGPTVVTGP